MTRWQEIVDGAPEFASSVQAVFDAYLHKTLATLRRDGSPRISAVEAQFVEGDLWLGMMPDSLKARDLLRDPRMALHCATVDTTLVAGDAKVAGRAEAVDDPRIMLILAHGNEDTTGGAHLFRIDLDEVVLTHVEGDELVVDSWHAGRGIASITRR